jgi:hypothetical protein
VSLTQQETYEAIFIQYEKLNQEGIYVKVFNKGNYFNQSLLTVSLKRGLHPSINDRDYGCSEAFTCEIFIPD